MAREDWQAMEADSGAGPDSHTMPDLCALDRLIFKAHSRIYASGGALIARRPDIERARQWLVEAQQALSDAYDLVGVNREYTL